MTSGEKLEQQEKGPSPCLAGSARAPDGWAASGLRGWRASAWHTAVRLATDETLENAAGVGSPPWTWSRQDRVVAIGGRAIDAVVTVAVADRLVPLAPTAAPTAPRPDPAATSGAEEGPP